MTNAIVPITEIQEQLRAKVHAAMFELLPAEAFDAYIKKTWESLTQDREERTSSYDSKTTLVRSELFTMIQVAMRAELKKRVEAWAAEWSKGELAAETAKHVLLECTRIASASFLNKLASDVIASVAGQFGAMLPVSCSSCGHSCLRNAPCQNCRTWN